MSLVMTRLGHQLEWRVHKAGPVSTPGASGPTDPAFVRRASRKPTYARRSLAGIMVAGTSAGRGRLMSDLRRRDFITLLGGARSSRSGCGGSVC